MQTDALGSRMKKYEWAYRFYLPTRSYVMIRVDGKAFHTYTKGLKKPYDEIFMQDMNDTAIYLCKNIMGAKFAFVQSDEISILITDFEKLETESWFNSNLQKMCSISASMATRAFNEKRFYSTYQKSKMKWAEFDSRVFILPSKTEVINYFIWRQQDTTKNAIQSAARTFFSDKQLFGKNGDQMQEMLFTEKQINFNNYPDKFKRGRIIIKETYDKAVDSQPCLRTRWISQAPPIFTQDREYLNNLIPNNL